MRQIAALAVLILGTANCVFGQTPHRFWDKTNVGLFSGVATVRALDVHSTEQVLRRGGHETLLPDGLVRNRAAFSAYSAGNVTAGIGVAWVFHKTGHHKLERWSSVVHIAFIGTLAGHNYTLRRR